MRRSRMSFKHNKSSFSRGTRVHFKNALGAPMRGGIRL